MKLNQIFTAIIHLHRRQPLTALLIWLNAMVVSGILALLVERHYIYWFCVCTCFFAGMAFVFLATTLQGLVARIRAGDGGPEWNVLINGVSAGQISDSAYALIRRDVLLDYRVYLQQFENFIHMALRILSAFIVMIPVLLFWVIIAFAIFSPQAFVQAVTAFQKITPAMVLGTVLSVSEIFAPLFFIYLGLLMMIGRPFGFVNRFDDAVCKCVRRAVECSAIGDVFLFRLDEPWAVRAFATSKKWKTKHGEVVHP